MAPGQFFCLLRCGAVRSAACSALLLGAGAGSLAAGRSSRIHRHPLAVFAKGFKLHHAVHFGEEGVVATATHVGARINSGAELADKDAARCHALAAEAFHAAPLSRAIATVSGAAARLFMSHEMFSENKKYE